VPDNNLKYPLSRRPITIRGVRIPTRIVRAAQGTQLSREVVNDTVTAFHLARARGGCGLTILADGRVHESGHGLFNLWEPKIVDGLSQLAEKCHAEGMVLFQELTHQGGSVWYGSRPWAPSPTVSPVTGLEALEMSQSMIDDVIEGFAASAAQVVRAGIRGIEIHAGHGFLVGQFLSPASNLRTDGYGGSENNRARFLVETLTAVRGALGPNVPIGVRLSASERLTGGIEVEHTARLARRLQELALIDFVDVSLGGMHRWDEMIGPMSTPHAYQLAFSRPIKAAVDLPVMITGRITTLAGAEQLLADDEADLVSLVRATIADPDLPRKSWAGHEEDVRPCIACNRCVRSIVIDRRLSCAVNPSIGADLDVLVPARVSREVLVIGGGPAGLECARVAAERGHRVTVLEAESWLGGAVEIARRAPHRDEFGAIVDWQRQQLEGRGVAIQTGVAASVDTVAQRDPDVVVVATGARAQTASMMLSTDSECGAVEICDPVQVLGGTRPQRGTTAVVIDELGSYVAVGVAESLAADGYPVTVLTKDDEFAPALRDTYEQLPALERLRNLGVAIRSGVARLLLAPDGVLVHDKGGGEPWLIATNFVVMVAGFVPEDQLTVALRAWGGCQVETVGAASGTDDLASAIATGFAVGSRL
jgi:2,4-dienoyl-CoA reductase-like NADH-dependent reductase (Old Yellow Enzyme family)/thioredoxin reductase